MSSRPASAIQRYNVRWEPISSIKPHLQNPRKDHDVDGIAKSIRAFGWRSPIVVWDGDGRVLAGHGRLLAAQQLGLEKVPVHRVGRDEITAAEAAAYRLADNRTAEKSGWDEQALLLEIDALGERERELAGFDQAYRDELESRLAALDGDGGVDTLAEWEGMPEYVSEDQTAWRSIIVHFPDEAALVEFSQRLGADVPRHERFMWYPSQPDQVVAGKRWAEG